MIRALDRLNSLTHEIENTELKQLSKLTSFLFFNLAYCVGKNILYTNIEFILKVQLSTRRKDSYNFPMRKMNFFIK